jgi:hypothetical protein
MVDDILIEEISECPEPYNLNTLATTNNAALISWKQAKLDGPWEIKYGVPGFNPETEGMLISEIQDQTFNIGGLNSGANYELYIRSNCQGLYSDWSTPLFFSTIPDPIQLPYFENFENSILPNLPPGYKNFGELWFGAKTYNDLGVSNSNSLYLIHGQYESKSIIILPHLDSDIEDLKMYFTYFNPYTNYHLEVGVIGDINNPASFQSFENIPLVFGTHQEANIDFSDYEGEDGNIAFKIEAGSTHQGGAHIWLDEIITFSPSELPSIIFKEVYSITMNDAIVSGRVMDIGSQTVSSRGFVWNTEPNPTIENNNGYVSVGSGIGHFQNQIDGLIPGTTYFIRAFATNAVGTAYTEQEIFQTNHQSFNIITATSGQGGNINPEGDVNVNYAQNQTFTITPDIGYEIADVLVDGVSVGAVGTYTFSNVTADHSIEASFSMLTYTITASAGENGSINPAGDVVVQHGEDLTFNFNPSESYQVYAFWVDGDSIGQADSYTFTNVTANHTIHVSFTVIIGLEELDEVIVQASPNPMTETVHIHLNALPSAARQYTYALFDGMGRPVKQGEMKLETTAVQVESLPAGIYFLRVHQNSMPIFKVKLIKQ